VVRIALLLAVAAAAAFGEVACPFCGAATVSVAGDGETHHLCRYCSGVVHAYADGRNEASIRHDGVRESFPLDGARVVGCPVGIPTVLTRVVPRPGAAVTRPSPPVRTSAPPVRASAPPVALPAAPVEMPAHPAGLPGLAVSRPAHPIARPASPVSLPAHPTARPASPVSRPAAPAPPPETPVTRPAHPVAAPDECGQAAPRTPPPAIRIVVCRSLPD